MKAGISLLIIILIGITELSAADLNNAFIRKPGEYKLDTKGSLLTIAQTQTGSWTLKVRWALDGGASSTAEPEDCLRAEGWFVFVEKPGRIWVFDGVDGGALLSNTEKESGVKHLNFSQTVVGPREFREALPKNVRSRQQSDVK
jgi:hypothetical protein